MAEAGFMTGLERNSEAVQVLFAPYEAYLHLYSIFEPRSEIIASGCC